MYNVANIAKILAQLAWVHYAFEIIYYSFQQFFYFSPILKIIPWMTSIPKIQLQAGTKLYFKDQDTLIE